MSKNYPGHKPTPEKELKSLLFAMGATEETLYECLDKLNKRWDDLFAQMPGGRMHEIGFKPRGAANENVMYYTVPNSELAIRIWSGGLESYGQYCIDFFHVRKRIAVNTPRHFAISHALNPGVFTFGGKLVSWEEAMKVGRLNDGQEKYSAPEGASLVLTRPSEPPFYFQLPIRSVPQTVVYAQPSASLP